MREVATSYCLMGRDPPFGREVATSFTPLRRREKAMTINAVATCEPCKQMEEMAVPISIHIMREAADSHYM